MKLPILLLAITSLFLCSCATLEPGSKEALLDSAKRTLGHFAVTALQDAVKQEISTGRVDFASAAAAGAWAASGEIVSWEQIAKVVMSYSGNNLPATAVSAAMAFDGGMSAGQHPANITNAIAAVISAAALEAKK